MQRAEYAKILSKQWTAILTDLMDSPVADGAAEMTEKELAEVVRKIVAEQKAAAEKLEDLMAKKVEEGDSFERFDHFKDLRERLERRADRLFERPAAAPANGRDPHE
jgi:RAB protein geranylgeranyltransferase component A